MSLGGNENPILFSFLPSFKNFYCSILIMELIGFKIVSKNECAKKHIGDIEVT